MISLFSNPEYKIDGTIVGKYVAFYFGNDLFHKLVIAMTADGKNVYVEDYRFMKISIDNIVEIYDSKDEWIKLHKIENNKFIPNPYDPEHKPVNMSNYGSFSKLRNAFGIKSNKKKS